MKNTRKKKLRIICIIILLFIAVFAAVTYLYINDYYKADSKANSIALSHQLTEDIIAFEPADSEIGFIFYPGGKVEYSAYAPLMNELAKNNITCILPHMTGNLAFFDMNIADEIKGMYPEIKRWYVGGHSLGGVAAASYISKHDSEYEGLILLASYSTKDLSATDLNVISIYGSNDKVLNIDSYNDSICNLPSDYKQLCIEGGNHAYFGCYGPQKGDGTAGITNEEQINITVDFITKEIGQN